MTDKKKKFIIKQVKPAKNSQRMVKLNQQAWDKLQLIKTNSPNKIKMTALVSRIIIEYIDNYAEYEYIEGVEQ
jgi:hypothetical protein